MSHGRIPTHLSDPLVVVSDIHLKNLKDTRGQLLLNLLERVDPVGVEYFVLLGDIFDFCLGSHPYFQSKFAPLGAALSRLSSKGVKVIFFEGNHEFVLDQLGWPGVEFVTEAEKTIVLSNQKRIAMCHGDLLAADAKYLKFRSFVKSGLVTKTANAVPGAALNAYAMTHSRLSRMRHEYSEQVHPRVLRGVEQWVNQTTADAYLFGHFHIPYCENLPKGGQFVSVESWDNPNVLLLNEEGHWLRSFPQNVTDPFETKVAHSIL